MKFIKVTKAKYMREYILYLEFSDGLGGSIDLSKEIYGEVFEPLKDPEYFKKFNLDNWTITWDCGADFAPEFLYQLALKQNVSVQEEAED